MNAELQEGVLREVEEHAAEEAEAAEEDGAVRLGVKEAKAESFGNMGTKVVKREGEGLEGAADSATFLGSTPIFVFPVPVWPLPETGEALIKGSWGFMGRPETAEWIALGILEGDGDAMMQASKNGVRG